MTGFAFSERLKYLMMEFEPERNDVGRGFWSVNDNAILDVTRRHLLERGISWQGYSSIDDASLSTASGTSTSPLHS